MKTMVGQGGCGGPGQAEKTARVEAANRSGIVLVAVVTTFLALGVLGGTLALVGITDLRMTGRYRTCIETLYDADAAVRYVKTRIDGDLASGAISLTGAVIGVNYAAPQGMSFEPVRELVRMADTSVYMFTVRDEILSSRCFIEVTFRPASAMEMGLVGDDQVDTKAYSGIYSYDSRVLHDPGTTNSTGDAMIACNGQFITHQDTVIDGSFVLGAQADGTRGTWSELPGGGSIVTGEPALPVDRIDPDPLGVVGGELAADFATYSITASNDNSLAVPPITAPHYRINLGNGETMTLGSGNYYVTDITLRNGSSLIINPTAGPVNIYLAGQCEAKEGSSINFIGDPPDFNLFSNSDRSIILKNGGSFRGTIYAPLSDIQVRNNGDFYGICWGNSVTMMNSGQVYLDLAAMKAFQANSIVLLTWKEVR